MKDKKDLNIIVTQENKQEFIDIRRLAHTYIDQGKNVPLGLVDRLFEIMYEKGHYEDHLKWRKAYQQAATAFEKITGMRDFQFYWEDRILGENKQTFELDTKYVFAEIIHAFSNYNDDYPAAGKDEAIAFVYLAFDEEYKSMMKKKDKSEFTPYKQAIISGIVAAAMGFKITRNANPSNGELFEATRNAITKYKTKKSLFSKF
jgi:hypothetical protein